jgi:hypothetical protein
MKQVRQIYGISSKSLLNLRPEHAEECDRVIERSRFTYCTDRLTLD